MIQNIYTNFDTEYKNNKNKQKNKQKINLFFVQLAFGTKTYVKLPQRRPYTI